MEAALVPVELFLTLCGNVCGGLKGPLCQGSRVEAADIDKEKAGGFGGTITLLETKFLNRPMSIFKLWWRRPTSDEYDDILSPEILTIRGRLRDTGIWAYGSGTQYQNDVDVAIDLKTSFRIMTPAAARFMGEVLAKAADLSRNVRRDIVWAGEKTEMP